MSLAELTTQTRECAFSLHSTQLTWQNDLVMISVDFDSCGVVAARLAGAAKLNQTFVDNLLWRAKRQWHPTRAAADQTAR
jgi:hypothetical protein